jgi:protein O-mannosyl-transferase
MSKAKASKDLKRSRSTSARLNVCIALLLTAITLVVCWQALGFNFISYDDPSYVAENPYVHAGLTLDTAKWAITTPSLANWHPLTWISLMTDTSVFGTSPRGYHLTNVLLHILNTLLLFFLLIRMTGYVWRGALVAALFAVHPIHVESVAWVAERKDVLSAFFWLLAMLAYVRYTERPGLARYSLVVVAFALGLMAKPVLVTLPLALLLCDYWPLNRFSAKNRWSLIWEKLPLFGLTVASCVVTYLVQASGGSVTAFDRLPIGVRAANVLVSYVRYIGKAIWPTRLAIIYPHPLNSLPAWETIASGLLLVGLTYLAIRSARRRPYILVGWLWYIITLVPMIGLVQVGRQALADRYTYIPLLGLFIILAWGVPDILASARARFAWVSRTISPNKEGRALVVISLALVVGLSILCHRQVSYWRDSKTLFEHTLACTSGNYIAHNQMGSALRDEGNVDAAMSHFNEAIHINPNFSDAYGNLGGLFLTKGNVDKAMSYYATVVRLAPTDPRGHYNLGLTLQLKGNTTGAIREYQEAIRLRPDYVKAHCGLAAALAARGEVDGAIVHFTEVIRIKPDYADVHTSLADLYFRKTDYTKAWAEVYLARRYGGNVSRQFIHDLSAKMPEPAK